MQGVLIAQLFRLRHIPGLSHSGLSFYEVGVPLSASCHGIAVVVALVGAYRFWKQQSAVSSGKIFSGGWELNLICLFVGLVSIVAVSALSLEQVSLRVMADCVDYAHHVYFDSCHYNRNRLRLLEV